MVMVGEGGIVVGPSPARVQVPYAEGYPAFLQQAQGIASGHAYPQVAADEADDVESERSLVHGRFLFREGRLGPWLGVRAPGPGRPDAGRAGANRGARSG